MNIEIRVIEDKFALDKNFFSGKIVIMNKNKKKEIGKRIKIAMLEKDLPLPKLANKINRSKS